MRVLFTLAVVLSAGCSDQSLHAIDDAEPGEDSARPEDIVDTDPPAVNNPPEVQILVPTDGEIFEPGAEVGFLGEASDPDGDALTLDWRSDVDGPLSPDLNFLTSGLAEGWHEVTLTATDPGGLSASDSVRVGVCSWGSPVDFDHDLDAGSWLVLGDAYWDPGGWLELTGLNTYATGAIYNVVDKIDAGAVEIGFRIYTGGGSGADGFAMSVLHEDTADFMGGTGGCLGYGAAPFGCDATAVDSVVGYHVEFDTYQNGWEPTANDHVAISLNGDPGAHLLWADLGEIEDSTWHDVVVRVAAPYVEVEFDGAVVMSGDVPGLEPFTGYIGFTGTTGSLTNYHRFDELQIDQECMLE